MAFSLLDEAERRGHEQLVFFNYPHVGLRAFIGVHSTVLGPGLGGCRIKVYEDEASAIEDVLRLSEGMTYKNSLAGIPFGGGKACIMLDPNFKGSRRDLFVQFGKCVDSLGGRYVTAEDMGTTVQDIEWMLEGTDFVTGRNPEKGGAGDPSPWTAKGVFLSMQAAAEKAYGTRSLAGKKVAIQGVGNVGKYLIKHLMDSEAKVAVTDINKDALSSIASMFPVEVVELDAIYDVDCDVYSPNAIGQTVNHETLPRLKCKIIAGGANNQLVDESVYSVIEEREMLYMPDFAINSGGVISVGAELNDGGWNESWVSNKVDEIYQTAANIISESEKRKLFPEVVALQLAKERIEQVQLEAA